ncbi:MAG: ADP-ribosylglycohydrolase family protein [Clostridia bacterium]|nr:ADP-ribosylglycohydrolase family protein [Clostridia bacterium]
MLGAIIGDIVGSIYEFNNYRSKVFNFFSPSCFFTDDSVMTFAVFEALNKSKGDNKKLEKLAVKEMQKYGSIYPNMSYGGRFALWLKEKSPKPYNSFGNGSAMRVSAVSYFANSLDEVKNLSKIVTSVSHNHEEGIKGAEATAVAVFLALQGKSKQEIKEYIEDNYYSLDYDYEDLKKNYFFNETCQNTVPQAIYCFLISEDFEDSIRIGVSIGGDTDTLCAITGAIAEAYYGIDSKMREKALGFLDKNLLKKYNEFSKIFKDKIKII